MRLRCALCGRPTTPFVTIGREPVGPTCARRAGLDKPAKGGRVRLFGAQPRRRGAGPEQMALFALAGAA